MSWSQAKIRKWHKDNPGRSRIEAAILRAFRRHSRALAANLLTETPMLKALKARETYRGKRIEYVIVDEY